MEICSKCGKERDICCDGPLETRFEGKKYCGPCCPFKDDGYHQRSLATDRNQNARVIAELERLRHVVDHLRYETETKLKSVDKDDLPDLHAYLSTVVAECKEDIAAYDRALKALEE
jgi:hypothetical protein